MRINNYIIELVDDRKSFYNSIYSLKPINMKTLKVYINNNLANNFIMPFKSPIRALIFFDKKPDNSLRLCTWIIKVSTI